MVQYGTEDIFLEKTSDGTPFAAKLLFAMVAMKMARNYGDELQSQRLQAQALNDRFQDIQRMNLGSTRDALQHTTPRAFVAPVLPMGGPSDPNAMMGIPLGWDQGMVRTASIARAVGSDMAKVALGIPPVLPALQRAGQAVRGAFQSGATKRLLAAAEEGGVGSVAKGVPPVAGPYRTPGRVAPAPAPAAAPVAGKSGGLGKKLLAGGALGLGAAGVGAFALGRGSLGYLSKEQRQPTYGGSAFGAPQLAYGVNQYGYPQLGAPFIQ